MQAGRPAAAAVGLQRASHIRRSGRRSRIPRVWSTHAYYRQEGQHPQTGQRAPPISGGRDL